MSADIHLFSSYQSSKELIETNDRFELRKLREAAAKRGISDVELAAIEREIAAALWSVPEQDPA